MNISTLSSLYYSSKDFMRLTEDLIAFFRDLIVVKETGGDEELVICGELDRKKFKALAERFSYSEILRYMEILRDTLEKMPRALNKRIAVELAFLRMIKGEECDGEVVKVKTFSAPKASVGAVKTEKVAPAPVKTEPTVQDEPPFEADALEDVIKEKEKPSEKDFPPLDYDRDPDPPFEEKAAEVKPEKAPEKTTAEDVISSGFYDRWNDIVAKLKENRKMSLWSLLIGSSAEKNGNKLIIKTKNAALLEMLENVTVVNEIAAAAKEVTGESLYATAANGPKAEPADRFASWLENNKNDIDMI